MPPERNEITVAPEILRKYTGTYAVPSMGPAVSILAEATVTLEGNQLMFQGAGGEKAPLFAESETSFFLKVTNGDLVVYDLARDTPTQLTFDPAVLGFPTWSPNGERVLFTSGRDSAGDVFWRAADGTGQVERLIATGGAAGAFAWSADGQTLVVNELRASRSIDIGLFSMDRPDDPIEWVLDGDSNQASPDV